VSVCVLLAGFAVGVGVGTAQVLNESIRTQHFEDLVYPLAARLAHVQGVVVVRVQLDDGGRVTTAAAISGPKALISDSITNARKWRFQPNLEKTAVIVYSFRFEGLCNLPCSSQSHYEPPNFVTVTTGSPVIDHSGQ
jgi:TonB family protein